MVQETGKIWTAETLFHPILPKSDRLLNKQATHLPVREALAMNTGANWLLQTYSELFGRKAKAAPVSTKICLDGYWLFILSFVHMNGQPCLC